MECNRWGRDALLATIFGLILAFPLAAEDQRPTVADGPADKPHLRESAHGTSIGGYIDHELFWNDKKKTFDQHRFIPFIHGEVSDRIHVMAELEFEHGGLVKGSGDSDGEIKLEFATLDISFAESFSYRGGVILSPLGKFNLIHDSPLNDFTNRPLVAREIVPTLRRAFREVAVISGLVERQQLGPVFRARGVLTVLAGVHRDPRVLTDGVQHVEIDTEVGQPAVVQ